MRIADVSSAYTLIGQLQGLKSDETDLENQLVSGKKIDELSDDSSTSETLLNSQVERETLVQNKDNCALCNNIAKAGVDALGSIDDQIDLALKVAESAQTNTDSTSSTANASYAETVDDIISSVLASANEKYGDDYLFGGSASGSAPFVATYDTDGKITGVAYNGAGNGRQITVSDGVTVSPFTDDTDNNAIGDTLNQLIALRDAISGGDSTALSTATSELDKAQSSVVDASSSLGTTQARLELISTRNSNKYTNLDNAEEAATNSSEEEVTVKLLAAQNAYSAALQGTSLLLGQTLLDYL